MYINKGPDHDRTSIHALHQDSAYFPWTGQDFVVACWTALVDVTRENGCLVVLPGSHKDGLREHGVPDYMETNAGFHTCTGRLRPLGREVQTLTRSGIKDYIWRGTEEYAEVRATGERRPLVFAEMKAGDTIFFHPMVVHGSGFNLTKDTCRKSLTVHYGSARSRYFAQDQFVGTPQDYIANEIMTSIQRVKKEDVRPDVARESHLNTWKATSRQVCGHDYRNELKIDDYL